jgi:hypothetical protein
VLIVRNRQTSFVDDVACSFFARRRLVVRVAVVDVVTNMETAPLPVLTGMLCVWANTQ